MTTPPPRRGGRGAGSGAHVDFDWAEIEVGFRGASREVQQFLARNEHSINRTLGGLQAFGGAVEILGGAALVGGGVATSEAGVGVVIAGAGAWMVANGYDNFDTGWRALLTGTPHQTRLHTSLRQLGLSDAQANATEILLGGGVTTGAARLGRQSLEEAARAGLAQRMARQYATEPLNVRVGRRSLWAEPSIERRGIAWEAYDAERTGFERLPPSFPTIDQIHRESGTVISNKTLDLALRSYSRQDRNGVYNRLAAYVDRLAAFREGRGSGVRVSGNEVAYRALHVLVPADEVLPGQALQLAAAEQYAIQRGVNLRIEYAH
ncbi:hypothetical protein U91I_00704 [alpha proteobacterium U9-1i]|nr:hypothetical protein U91I_00704 [alpha proteobacterium U9-1i]